MTKPRKYKYVLRIVKGTFKDDTYRNFASIEAIDAFIVRTRENAPGLVKPGTMEIRLNKKVVGAR